MPLPMKAAVDWHRRRWRGSAHTATVRDSARRFGVGFSLRGWRLARILLPRPALLLLRERSRNSPAFCVTSAGLFLPTLGFLCASQLHFGEGLSKATSSWSVGF